MPRKRSHLLHRSPALDSPAPLPEPDTMDFSTSPNFQLATEETCSRLNQIDKLRALGVGGCVSLPQLVVCGDQSTGKSSILERLSGISFPRKDGLCTRFATEIVLRHSNTPLEVVVTIRPHGSRDATSRSALESFKKTFSTLDSMHLPDIIEEAGSLMGLRGYGADEGKAFSLDQLHIRVTGSTSLHLTIVDLPGLIAVQNDEQTQDDVNTVHSLADTYLKSPRTIILAVIQAGNDIANQSVVQKAKTHDPEGIRTVGIITKPDLINPGTESRIVQLANNEGNVRLNLGFFLLKNLAPNNTMPTSSSGPDKVNKKERSFFKHPAWEGLDPDRIGIANMKKFLRNLLQDHIEREIPSIKDELRKKLAHAESEYQTLGKPRQTAQDIRTFLIEKNMALHQLVQNALSGSYLSDSAFFSDNTRLRAMIHQENMAFAEEMRISGGKRKITSSSSQGPDTSNQTPATIKSAIDEVDAEQGQLRVTHHQMMDWVKEVSKSNVSC
jgi:GTPase SAR1 family protein